MNTREDADARQLPGDDLYIHVYREGAQAVGLGHGRASVGGELARIHSARSCSRNHMTPAATVLSAHPTAMTDMSFACLLQAALGPGRYQQTYQHSLLRALRALANLLKNGLLFRVSRGERSPT